MPNRSQPAIRPAVAIAAAGMVLALACSPAPEPAAPAADPPSLVLLVVDTLRADRLGVYGYPRDTSPRIDAFAREARIYRRAVASSPWTLPSHASLFTGKPPFAHGAHGFLVNEPVENSRPLRLEETTLAEVLATAGYETAAFVANSGYLARHWQLDQGFASYVVDRRPGSELNRRHVLPWLEERTSPSPFFLFVNYMDAHRPYQTASPDGTGSATGRTPAESEALLDEAIERILPRPEGPLPSSTDSLLRHVSEDYDAGVRNADHAVGQVLDALRRLGLDGETVVVVTSDHGEYLGEHRLVEHSKDVYQPVLSVPLLLRVPGGRSHEEIEERVVSHDLPHLVLRHWPAGLRGQLLAPFPDPFRPVVSELYFSRTKDLLHPRWGERFRRVRRAVFTGSHKWIASSDGADELYDLSEDPAESRNLAQERRAVAARARRALHSLLSSAGESSPRPDGTPPALDEATRRELEALGYVH